MKWDKFQYNTLLLSFCVSLIVFVIIALSIPDIFSPYYYKTSINHIGGSNYSDSRLAYYDFDNDGLSEKILAYNNRYSKNVSINLFNHNNSFLCQVNFKGGFNHSCNVFKIGPIYDSIYHDFSTVTIKDDSLFLNIANFNIDDDSTFVTGKVDVVFLDKIIPNTNNLYDFVYDIKIHDANKDGVNEIYAQINAGYSLYPRKLYKYDIKYQHLYKSNTDGNCGNSNLSFYDLNNDGIDEAIGCNYACWNIGDTTKYNFHDQNAYVMTFDTVLNFFFKPIVHYGGYTSITHQVIHDKTEPLLAILSSTPSQALKQQTLDFYNSKGNRISHHILPERSLPNSFSIKSYNDESYLYLFDRDNNFFTLLNSNFKEVSKLKTPPNARIYKYLDIFNKGEKNLLFHNLNEGKLYMAVDGEYYELPMMKPIAPRVLEISMRYNGTKEPQLCIFEDNTIHLIKIIKNQYTLFKYPFYIFIWFLIFSAVYFILNLQSKIISQRFKEKEHLRDLELSSTYNQLDPHFTFNALNAIGASIIIGNKNEAYDYFVQFSELIRLTLERSIKSAQTLGTEIDFIQQYLKIEKIRFKDRLNYSIDTTGGINKSILIPKMLIQIFVENAIKHGINPKKEGGSVQVSITAINNTHTITIEDNGIGRKNAKELNTTSTGKGLNVMDKYIKLFNKQNNINIYYQLIDLYDKRGNATGTRVEIILL